MPQNLTRRAFLARLAKVAGVAVAAPVLVKAAGTSITWQLPDVVDRYTVLGRSGDYLYKCVPMVADPHISSGTIISNQKALLRYQELLEPDRRYRLNADLFR